MNKQELMNKIKEQCGDCEAWSGTDCTRNPYTQGCLKDEEQVIECHDEQVGHAENVIAEQKAEIESLKKDYIELDLECRELRTELDKELAEHEEFTQKAKAEIERLTRELDDTISMNEMYVEKVRQNAELQKQVDELKETNRKLFEYGASKIVECEQAVKDTVKEIWLKAKSLEEEENDYDFPLYTFGLWLNRRFGVEVE